MRESRRQFDPGDSWLGVAFGAVILIMLAFVGVIVWALIRIVLKFT